MVSTNDVNKPNYQKVFTILSAVYLVIQCVLCVVCYMVNYEDSFGEALARLVAFAIIQVFTPYIAMMVAGALPNLIWKLVWQGLGLAINLFCIPVLYLIFTLANSVRGRVDLLYELQLMWLTSFVIVTVVKIILDITISIKRRRETQNDFRRRVQ